MSKIKSVWYCTSCGYESPKWMGRCPSCGEWNTMVEEPKRTSGEGSSFSMSRQRIFNGIEDVKPVSLNNIDFQEKNRISIGSVEVERILGGGIVPGSMILLAGEPGIGKSTLALQIPLICPHLRTLYVSGEESPQQIKLRALRIANNIGGNGIGENCIIFGETRIENILECARQMQPQLLIIDSIQTIYTELLESSASSVSQVKECAAMLLRYTKESNVPVIVIGHITKEGSIAGPKVLEHIVDVVLRFEGDSRHSYRILRSIKNRFGSTDELAIFEMTGSGLREVNNPSEILTPMHEENLSGIAVGSMIDGTRPFMIEIQALVSTAAYGVPQRSATGFDSRRLNMLLAVLEKRAGFKLAVKDVFLNVAGGMKVSDPACDLAVISAILSSNFDLSLSSKTCFAAEVGLSGEIRPVSRMEQRISEAARLGYKEIYISSFSSIDKHRKNEIGKEIDIIEINDTTSLCRRLFNPATRND